VGTLIRGGAAGGVKRVGLAYCRADVDLEPTGEGTVIRWHSSFDPKCRAPGGSTVALSRFIERTVQGLAARADAIDGDRRPSE
jgi:hypothetical protein